MSTQTNNLRSLLSSVLTKDKKPGTKDSQEAKQMTSSKSLIPELQATSEENNFPIWKVRFEVLRTSTPADLYLEIDGDMFLGVDNTNADIVNLMDYDNQIQGVSRRHLKLSPTETDLFIIDLESTNGTRKNGRLIHPNCPYPIHDGDILELGNLLLAVNILEVPHHAAPTHNNNIVDALSHISIVLSSNLNIDQVLDRILQTAVNLCLADKVALLLWDERANEFHLEAERGIVDLKTPFINVSGNRDFLINEVLQKGEPVRCKISNGLEVEVVKRDLIEEAIYVPVTAGDVSIGVLVAMQEDKEKGFSRETERTLCTIAGFAAVAILNSHKIETTNRQLERKVEELSTYNTFSKAMSNANTLTGLYNALRDQIREYWRVENLGLWLVDEAKENLVPFPKPSFYKTYSMGQELIGTVASRAEAKLATDIRLFSEPTNNHEPTLQLLACSAACVPIVENNNVIGVLALFSTRENEFDEEDIRLLQALSQAASSAIRNALLFEQINRQRATILAAVNMLPHPMMIVDQDGKIIVSNRAADTMLDEVHSVTNGKEENRSASLMPLFTLINGLSDSKWQTREIILAEKVYVATLEYASMVGTIILMQDVTDPVTGTSNRRHFQNLAEQAFQQAKRYTNPLAALVIGFDNLGQAASEQGYTTRNHILKRLGSELRKFLRTPDILGRYQDEEFVVILPETNLENASVVAERIVQSMFKKSFMDEDFRFSPRLSIGVAVADFESDESIDTCMEKAYDSLILAKADGKHHAKVYKKI